MGTKRDLGKYDCYKSALPDEPMFILLGRDHKAPAAVRSWALMYSMKNGEDAKHQEAMECANAMEAWREENEGRIYTPEKEGRS